jgi:hypothetical protein
VGHFFFVVDPDVAAIRCPASLAFRTLE